MKQDSVARIYIMTIAFVTALWGQILVVPLLVIFATIVAAITGPRWKTENNGWAIFCCGLLFATIVFRCIVPHTVDQAYWLMPAWLVLSVAEFLLLASALELFRFHDRGKLPTHFPAWGLGVLICNHHYAATSLHRYLFLLSALLCVFLAIVFFQLNRAEKVRRYQQRQGQFSMLGVLLVLIGMLAWQSYELFANTINPAATWLFEASVLHKQQKLMYEGSGTLDAITILRRQNPDATAISVQSVDAPNYLRGQVYDLFNSHRWTRYGRIAKVPGMFNTPPALPEDVRKSIEEARLGGSEQVFPTDSSSSLPSADSSDQTEPTMAMRLLNDPERGRRYFTPLNVTYIKGVSPKKTIELGRNNVVYGGLSEREWYTVYFRDDLEEALSFQDRQLFTQNTPTAFSQFASDQAKSIYPNSATPAEKIAAIENHCQSNFRLRQEDAPSLVEEANRKLRPMRGDPPTTQQELQKYSLAKSQPLTHFLMYNPPATCEYFATAATMLLRDAGVPARYVTGYVVRTPNGKQQWRARNRDAHAWVEAYDGEARRWVTVEPTPGMKRTRQTENGTRRNSEKLAPRPKSKVQIAKVEEKRAYRNIEYWLKKFLGMPAILFFAMATVIAIFISRRSDSALSEEQVWLTYVERILRKHDLVRRDAETLHQFAHRVEMYPYGSDRKAPAPREFAEWLTNYADYRYGSRILTAPPGFVTA